ncbi:MCM DNA helicase complex subunit [Coelomomyces lativittatus]|nr:MCM DNA helicase complex subunit [Coelomomyces lativittatus]KAJ1505538.1 MCM DNA helicase complex subunit [Coelomomyces lativittatus]
MVQVKSKRLIVDIDDLRSYDPELCENLLQHPVDYLPAFEKSLKDIIVATHHPPKLHGMQEHLYYVGFKGAFGKHHVNPRSLNASYLGQLIALEGIVTRCSLVRPKMVKSVHYCEKTQLFHSRDYRDATMIGETLPTGITYPTEDDQGNPLTTEFGYSTFLDHQWISMQEMPERAPPGQLPRSIDVLLSDDVVDQCKPGDRIHVVGVYRSVGGGVQVGTFKTFVYCCALHPITTHVTLPPLTEQDVQHIRQLAHRSSVVDILANSLAPSIFGHRYIKKAVLLLLLGGIERNLENGTHLRGDINILLLGDPSTAKSQFLRWVLQVAPLAIATTGRGATGVGLTAAVTTDPDTGDRRLEAGAMVLADRGIVCIDELDKMNDTDRVAMHEVMEQQTITLAKAGIHASLNARCSVLAAANPTYGQYDETLEPHRNIRLPDSLLSRFDLLFLVLDKTDEAMDRQLSQHVLHMHRSAPPPPPPPSILGSVHEASMTHEGMSQDHFTMTPSASFPSSMAMTPLFSKTSSSSSNFSKRGKKRKDDILTLMFLKKYIHYAKTRIKPVLTDEASEVIVEEYGNLRNEKQQETRRTLPITARTLETLIRLSTAHAKARLSPRVEAYDADAAAELLRFALFKEYHKKKKPRNPEGLKKHKPMSSDSEDVEEEEAVVVGDKDEEKRSSLTTPSSSTPSISAERLYRIFKQRLDAVFQEISEVQLQQLPVLLHSTALSTKDPDVKFSLDLCQRYLEKLESEMGVYIDKETGMVYRM